MRILLVVALVLGVAAPVAVSNGMFEDFAVVDTAQAVFHQDLLVCPEGLVDEEANCKVDFVLVVPARPDWDRAMTACLREYSSNECYNSVNEGEF